MGSRKHAALAAAIVALGLLAGCTSGPAQSSPGLGGSDGVEITPGPDDATTGEGDDANRDGTRTPVLLRIMYDKLQNGSTIRMVQRDANCMRDELRDSSWKVPSALGDIAMGSIFTGSVACLTETSWATWDLSVTQPDGRVGTTVLEIGQNGLQSQGFRIDAKCWGGGSLSCTGSTGQGHVTGEAIVVSITFDRLPDPVGPGGDAKFCAMEGQFCDMKNAHSYLVAFGVDAAWTYRAQSPSGFDCRTSSFDTDPAPGRTKACFSYRL